MLYQTCYLGKYTCWSTANEGIPLDEIVGERLPDEDGVGPRGAVGAEPDGLEEL